METTVLQPEDQATKIALIQQSVDFANKKIDGVDKKLDNMANNYVTRIQMDYAFQPRDSKITDNEKAITAIEKTISSQKIWSWFRTVIAMILASVVTFLINSYLQNIK